MLVIYILEAFHLISSVAKADIILPTKSITLGSSGFPLPTSGQDLSGMWDLLPVMMIHAVIHHLN